MNRTNVLILVAVIGLAIIGAFVYFERPSGPLSLSDISDSDGGKSGRNETQDGGIGETVTAKHQFKNGKHIVAGEINLPTPCHILSHTSRVAESFPEQVTMDFKVQTSGEICAQVITPARFKVEFTASENARISATLNGKRVPLNLIPVSQNEDLENFEIFIKG